MTTLLSHFIFFVTYERAQLARVLHYTKLEGIPSYKHSSLSGPFISYKEWKLNYHSIIVSMLGGVQYISLFTTYLLIFETLVYLANISCNL
jgi:hypothetical protein